MGLKSGFRSSHYDYRSCSSSATISLRTGLFAKASTSNGGSKALGPSADCIISSKAVRGVRGVAFLGGRLQSP